MVEYVINHILGKTILFTNRHEWTTEKIVSTYRAQFHVEDSFKQFKNIEFLSFRPVRHFTDRTIIVHGFYCVLAFTLSCLLQLEMKNLGYKMSINKIIDEFSDATHSLIFYLDNSGKDIRVDSVFSKNSEAVEEYIKHYGLKKYGVS
jgi:transposase